MPNTFSLKVIACDRVFFDDRCQQVILPLPDGSKAVQAHHENTILAVEIGEIKVQKDDGTWIDGVVGPGFAQVINNRVTVIVDTAEHPEEIDVRRAREAKERAEEQLRQKQSIQEYYMSQASLARAMSRLRVSSKNKSSGLK
ncbi:MAG: ATP synthase F1 subunit epsilon [Lachnospiraceae bacterium]